MYDITIIGAGIIGTSIAYELSKLDKKILVIEKSYDVGQVQSMFNSGIIHSGNDPIPGTLKAKLGVEGNKLYDEIKDDLGIQIRNTGGLIVGLNNKEVKDIYRLLERSKINGVEGVKLLTKDELRSFEPNLSDNVKIGLYMPTTKIIDPYQTTKSFMDAAITNGVNVNFNEMVIKIDVHEDYFKVFSAKQSIKTKAIINAAGIAAEDIALLLGEKLPVELVPTKGEYIKLPLKDNQIFNSVIYPTPSKKGKGVLFIPNHDVLLVGPTSIKVSNKYESNVDEKSIREVIRNSSKYTTKLSFNNIDGYLIGVRSSIVENDFYIEFSRTHKNVIHLAGIDSPGLSSAPAIARYVASMVTKKFMIWQIERAQDEIYYSDRFRQHVIR